MYHLIVECPDALALAQLFEERSASREAFEKHVDTCPSCRSLVAMYGELAHDASVDAEERTAWAMTLPAPVAPGAPVAMGSASALHAGDVVGERYVLEEIIGRGGMGVVWRARDLASGAGVAIKVLHDTTAELCKRFEREVRAVAMVGHPNVVEVHSVVSLPSGVPALVMSLLAGRSLADELDARGALPPAETRDLLLPLASALCTAHDKGIVHRDLKPQNVFLAVDVDGDAASARPVVTLLDFGLAKLVAKGDDDAEKLTRTGTTLGTPRYMAPEQLYGERADASADVWALGAVAYQCLAGKTPLAGKTLAQLVRSATVGAIEALPEAVPAPLRNVVHAMLNIDRSARPTMAQVHASLLA